MADGGPSQIFFIGMEWTQMKHNGMTIPLFEYFYNVTGRKDGSIT